MDVRGILKKTRGQSTVEYILLVAFGAILSAQLVSFFNGVFNEGLQELEKNIEIETRTGEKFAR
ncbi:MAG: hypothetical protein EBQ92_13885 [Proteobacteria bacterium]|nr:hypothetical protein [Pseudomonadota bacterium]